MTNKRILIVAGEASADRYGARLVRKIRALHEPDSIDFYGTGGDEMQEAGVHLLCHIRELAHIGVREALSSLRTYYRVFRHLIRHADAHRPDLAILLDFPDFNLRLAKKMKRRGIKVASMLTKCWSYSLSRKNTIAGGEWMWTL
jgi:lipid-A-disaccharide synthase